MIGFRFFLLPKFAILHFRLLLCDSLFQLWGLFVGLQSNNLLSLTYYNYYTIFFYKNQSTIFIQDGFLTYCALPTELRPPYCGKRRDSNPQHQAPQATVIKRFAVSVFILFFFFLLTIYII
jgi:hypothetical protein